MAEKLSKKAWEAEIHNIAVKAGEEWLKDMHKRGYKEANELGQRGTYEKVKNLLMREYPYDSITNDDMIDAGDIPSLEWANFASLKNYPDPRITQIKNDMTKYIPLLNGEAEDGKSWTQMGAEDLKHMSTNPEFGYKGNKEDFAKFLGKLSKYQTLYDRSKIADELRNSWWYKPSYLVYPSMMEGAENAVASGEGGTPAQILGLGALDAGTNLAIFGAPSMKFMPTAPIRNAAINAGAQGGAEAIRQVLKTVIDPSQEASVAAPIAAATLGLSRPGIVGTTQAAIARIPGKEAKEISRGVGKATRAGNPLTNEEDALRESVKQFNASQKTASTMGLMAQRATEATRKFMQQHPELKNLINDKATAVTRNQSVIDTERMLAMQSVKDKAKVLGVTANKDGTYDVEKFIEAYKKRPVYTWESDPEGVIKIIQPIIDSKNPTPELLQLSPKTADKYKAMFPARYADEAEATKLRTFGLGLGKVLGDLGGRVEPMIKANPLSFGPETFQSYDEMDWYKKRGPKARAIIDAAFKKAKEDREREQDEEEEDF